MYVPCRTGSLPAISPSVVMFLAERVPRQVHEPQVAELSQVHDVVELLDLVIA